MSLLAEVLAALDQAEVRYALIGAMAMATYGVSRSTQDLDLFTVDSAVFAESLWTPLRDAGCSVSILKGDSEDPLAGVVRSSRSGERPIDLVVGKFRWQRQALERSAPGRLGDVKIPILRAADLILLKIYAGGPQDAWDIQQMLNGGSREVLRQEVEERLADLRPESRHFWQKILAGS
ncbi:MAG TPA: hypothetical protein VMM92_15795 [Thermoanaerobaculia bacterium]|nr:hypothetical protein [Thermoanaerobaculia bacterium]